MTTSQLRIFANDSVGFDVLKHCLSSLPEGPELSWQSIPSSREGSRAFRALSRELSPSERVIHIQAPYAVLPDGADVGAAYRNDCAIRKLRDRQDRFFTLHLERLQEQLHELVRFMRPDLDLAQVDAFITGLTLPSINVSATVSEDHALYEERRLLLNHDDVLSDQAISKLDLRDQPEVSCLVYDGEIPVQAESIVILVDAKMESKLVKTYLGPRQAGSFPSVMVVIFSHLEVIRDYLSDPFFTPLLRSKRLKLWHCSEWEERFLEETADIRSAVPLCRWVIAPQGHPLDDVVRTNLKTHLSKFREFVDLNRQAARLYYSSDKFRQRLDAIAQGKRPRVLVERACTSVAIKQFSQNMAEALKGLGYEVYIHPPCTEDKRDLMVSTLVDLRRFKPDLLIANPNNFAKKMFLPPEVACPVLLSLQDLQPHMNFPSYVKLNPLAEHDLVLLMQERFREQAMEAGVASRQIASSVLPTEAPHCQPSSDTVQELWDVGYVKTMGTQRDLLGLINFERPMDKICAEEKRVIGIADTIIKKSIDEDCPLSIGAYQELAGSFEWKETVLQLAHEHMSLRAMKHLSLAGIKLGLSGANWELIPELRHCALQHIDDRALYQRRFLENRINISMNPWNEYHPRILDGGRVGAFFLVHQVAEDIRWQRLPAELEAGKHFDFFTTPQDLAEKCRYYLDRPELRKEMGENLRQVVEERFSYENVAERLIESWRALLQQQPV